MKREDLDDRQEAVVKAVLEADSRILVLGGPGAGKTTTALWTAREYLAASDQLATIPKARVLFLTFSRSAVSQIASRQAGVLTGYDSRVEISTFHALAYRIVRAFGRYAGFGTVTPSVQSEARVKLLGSAEGQFRYQDLVPAANSILEGSPSIQDLVTSRWGLIVCDEAQDTDEEQWKLLNILTKRKLLMLGDMNQMIYTFVPGVSQAQFERLKASADAVIDLEQRSHRDPSGAIPALAEAVRRREFDHEAVEAALADGRLLLHFDVDEATLQPLLAAEIRRSLREGSRDVGVFAHSNAAVAELAEILNAEDIDHVLVGIPEAHAEALSSMARQCAYGAGLADEEAVRESLALFLTASVRSQGPPEMALALIGRETLPGLVEANLGRLFASLKEAAANGTFEDLIAVATRSWENLGIYAAYRPWVRAGGHFRRLTNFLKALQVFEPGIRRLEEIIERSRLEALIDLDYSESGKVKLMNYHQTKGREADTVIHVFLPGDYFGRETEPFEKTSKLLNVAVSRARKNVIILLPSNPHALVEPFARYRPA